ncbi:MAG: hypothetical protein AB7P69_04940 [Candidatus Binatia bacterium]
MHGWAQKPKTRQRRVSWGVLLSLVGYFLNLCTQCPLVYADLLHLQVVQAHPTSAGHCSHPSVEPQTARPLTADHEGTTVPVCCDLMGASKTTLVSSVQLSPAPLLTLPFVPPGSSFLVEDVQWLHMIQARYSSSPPPLYLLYTTLLI